VDPLGLSLGSGVEGLVPSTMVRGKALEKRLGHEGSDFIDG
jgi:hypothetical protein